ncbi:MAG: GNAT family N-acetyltransferase [Xenococcaceae cyanobacterium MO_207.B15]|nr:GNAT family N-acetyltransferase [Xenococcaceae cyanobacterium MO_207.B15]
MGGLIVDENFRRNGIDRLLIQKAQIWAQQQECDFIQVRSQTIRQQAHVFYQNIGYELCKTQLVLRKQLNTKI